MAARNSLRHTLFVIAAVVCLCGSLIARAETVGPQKKLALFLYGGFSIPNNQSQGSGVFSGFTGQSLGLGLEYRMMPKTYLVFDLLNVAKSYNLITPTKTVKYNLSFVEIPLRIKQAITQNFHLAAGPYLTGLIVSATREDGGAEDSVKSDFSNDFGITVSGWLGFQATNSLAVGLEVRYDLGLADIQKDNQPANSIKTRAVLIMGTLVIGL